MTDYWVDVESTVRFCVTADSAEEARMQISEGDYDDTYVVDTMEGPDVVNVVPARF